MRLVPCLLIGLTLSLAAAAPPRPSLVVVISVDQFSAELMARWGKDLPGGLGRLYREGTAFQDAYQDHGYTETGPGHSVILTGRHPMHTGIANNTWLDPESDRTIYCVEDPASPLVGAAGGGVGPAHLEGSTLGEWITARIPGSRSFAVTGKDRSAILMAGHRATGVYWFAGAAGFVSAKAYTSTLPAWLTTYNTQFLADLGREDRTWTPLEEQGLPPAATYTLNGRAVTMALPRLIQGVGMPQDGAFWSRFKASPFFDQAILGAAQALEEAEHLGEGPGVDLLALGLSATDYVGHTFGNAGPEMLDNLRRLDRDLGRHLDRLQARVPGLWVVLTADHGAADFPERLAAQGIPARRLDPAAWGEAFNAALCRKLGVTRNLFLPMDGHQFYLDPAAPGPGRARVLEAAVALARTLPEVAEACSADELKTFRPDPQESPDRRSYQARLRLSYFPGRSGDLLLAFKPLIDVSGPSEVAAHGHPQDYDRRVPLVFWGPWRAERRTEPVRIVDLAPTLARELEIAPLEPTDGRALTLQRSGR